MLAIRYLLGKENKRRDAEPVDDVYDKVYIETTDAEGNKVEQKIPKVRDSSKSCVCPRVGANRLGQEYLDLTDIQNREFRYVL